VPLRLVGSFFAGIGYRIDGDMIVDNVAFSEDLEGSDRSVCELIKSQKDYPRWYPETREGLFKWERAFVPGRTPEIDRLELVIRSLGKLNDDLVADVIDAVVSLISNGLPPDVIYKSMVQSGFIEKLNCNRRQPLLDALEACCEIVHMQCLNGNTIREIRAIEESKEKEPKISRNAPCPCGSGKKYKVCCGRRSAT